MNRRSRYMRNDLSPEGFPVFLRITSSGRLKTLSREQIRFRNLPGSQLSKNEADLLRYPHEKFLRSPAPEE